MFKIFPASLTTDRRKIPLIKNWQEEATTDPIKIKLWQELYRDRITFWGIPTGATNGIFALDIDTKPGDNGWDTIKELSLPIPPTMYQHTLNGGTHFLFKFDPAKDTGNKVKFLKGLDLRSTGGWIAHYKLDLNQPLADAPNWIYEAVNKPKAQVAQTSQFKIQPEIALGIIQAALENIKEAPDGERNNRLNIECYKIGQMIANGSITRQFAETSILEAGKECGLPEYEIRATMKSGLDGGLANPMQCPFPDQSPVSNIVIPPPPETPAKWTPTFLTRKDLLNTSKLRKPQLFQDWSTEDIHITTADGGTGKTTLQLLEAICLALGERFLGFDCIQRGRTLYITGEDTADKLAAMLGAIMDQMGFMDGTPQNDAKIDTILNSVVIKKDADLCLITKDKQNFLHVNRNAFEKVMEAVQELRPKMIIFDPIASFWGSEAALNDMNKAVTKFMSELVDRSQACVVMINHMGKSSSANKDMSQFAGRGGSGLPSNSRVSRVMRRLDEEEFKEMTGSDLKQGESAILCNVNKFTDGSPLYNKPFIIIRKGYLFSRLTLTPMQQKNMEKEASDMEKVFSFIKQYRSSGKYVTLNQIVAYFMTNSPLSESKIKRAVQMLGLIGHLGERIIEIANPDVTKRESVYIIVDSEDKEIQS